MSKPLGGPDFRPRFVNIFSLTLYPSQIVPSSFKKESYEISVYNQWDRQLKFELYYDLVSVKILWRNTTMYVWSKGLFQPQEQSFYEDLIDQGVYYFLKVIFDISVTIFDCIGQNSFTPTDNWCEDDLNIIYVTSGTREINTNI